ncbi:hypothetical protein Raf01_23170 [Rugosimonospora africana]|uniref:Gp5/Type VI secretion system Vgr protein OB-fold domain-containing protein n=2 Tax=Rugosimonospora africana TaxID=556532 RepID=A0A8J3QN74_9ACTN|nr:hypothetical protein Raf01_23170 [Rugosimonospora africana]
MERIVAGLVDKVERRFYGKYRGTVVDNDDPARLGRLRVTAPGALGPNVVSGWATPCLPYGGAADQGLLFIPERRAGVWVEFAEGDLEFPIWVGTYWSKPGGASQVPKPNAADGSEAGSVQSPPTSKVIKTRKGHTIQFEDADGAEMLLIREGAQGHRVTMNADGITIVDKSQNTILLNQDGVSVTDAHGNGIEMTGDAMTLTAAVPLTINAAGKAVSITCASFDITKG